MSYRVRTEVRPSASGLNGTVYVLEGESGTPQAAVWPALGFNCFRWQVAAAGQPVDLLYTDPDLFANARPTRSGIPILFPFPNRIGGGRYCWAGKEYQLPLNDSKGPNAIHGFACRLPWRVRSVGTTDDSAWLEGEFWGSRDAPDSVALWASDCRIRITYRLGADWLRIEAVVDNPGSCPLPFGLGYHPYFRVPLGAGGSEQTCWWVEAEAQEYWELQDYLPTGARLSVDGARDLRRPRPVPELDLDDVYTSLGCPHGEGSLCRRARLADRAAGRALTILTSPAFRELVAFTPPHRQAVCLEPYTCTTDTLNLQPRGVDAGLLVLEPGREWEGVVEMRCAALADGDRKKGAQLAS
jgi:aldose 1-epimerase